MDNYCELCGAPGATDGWRIDDETDVYLHFDCVDRIRKNTSCKVQPISLDFDSIS